MNATEIMYMKAMSEGKELDNSWGAQWSGFISKSDIRKFEDECESNFNTDVEVKACVDEKMKSGKSSGSNKFMDLLNKGFTTFQNIKDTSQTESRYNSDYNYPPTPPKKEVPWGWITFGVIGVVGISGLVWYLRKKQKEGK